MQGDQTVDYCSNPGEKTCMGTGTEVAEAEALCLFLKCVLWDLLRLKKANEHESVCFSS